MKKFSILVIILGLVFMGYGGYQLYNTHHKQKQSLAEAQSLLEHSDLGDKKQKHIDIAKLAAKFSPSVGDKIGILDIPSLGKELPIIEGTDPDELAAGVGHYRTSSFPKENDQIVLSGHRDTVFRHMGDLKIGDILTVKLKYGDFSYKVDHTKIVMADDRTVIHSTSPDEVLTLTTCYPFSYVGHAPKRYIITALPVKKK